MRNLEIKEAELVNGGYTSNPDRGSVPNSFFGSDGGSRPSDVAKTKRQGYSVPFRHLPGQSGQPQ
ncbi:hypothetical protein ABW636_06125 [Aquimarina sp. 2201CG1-2-11]|uniref:hypothetical protein n=1 Tax=Aquimarina discodermiae TaxID=3231043 RepID=UPI003462B8C2